MLHRKASVLIIKYDCGLPHLKTEGSEVKSKWPCWDHCVNATERSCGSHCTPLAHRKEEGITNYWFLFPWIYKLQGKTWTQINWEPRWSKVSRMWNTGKLHYNILYYPRHFGLDFFFTSRVTVVMVFGPEEIQGKGKAACSASRNHVQAAVRSNPKPAPSLQSQDNKMMTGRRKPLHRRNPRSLSHMQQVTQPVHKGSIPGKFQNEQEIWTDFSCTFEIPSGIQCIHTADWAATEISTPS